MVGSKQFEYVNLRLQDIKQNQEPFGGVHIIAVGDLFQLKPVQDSWIFASNKHGYGPLAPNLWQDHYYMYMHELTQIMRQKDDKPFADLLNRLRTGNHTSNDIKYLQKRLIDPV